MEKLKYTLATVLTGLCWWSLCMDWELTMYVSGIIALIILWTIDRKKPSGFEKQENRNL